MSKPKNVVTVAVHPHVETVLPTAELRSRKRRKHAVPIFKHPVPGTNVPLKADRKIVADPIDPDVTCLI